MGASSGEITFNQKLDPNFQFNCNWDVVSVSNVSVSRRFLDVSVSSRLLTLTYRSRLGLDGDLVSVSNVSRRSQDVF
jgi:hypothetical protein